MKLAVVTDSTAYLPERIKNHEDLFIIPIPVILDGKVYNEGIDIEADEYYALLKNSKEFPTTSQPVSLDLSERFMELPMKSKAFKSFLTIRKSQVCRWGTW
jgi:fatty acid-binding protein DegV